MERAGGGGRREEKRREEKRREEKIEGDESLGGLLGLDLGLGGG